MPCNCDYMEPNKKEENSKEIAEHLVFINSIRSELILPEYIQEAANNIYGDVKNLNNMTILLCQILSNMSEDQLDIIVYNSKNKKSRRLADWWETHQEADEYRRKHEDSIKYENILLESALSKLSSEEKRVLKKMYLTEKGK